MFSGVTIVCFAASYAMTLALEITRLVLRSRIRGAVMLGFAGAGLFAHSTYLYYRAIHAIGPPLSSERDWYLLAAWVLAAVYLYLTYYHPRTAFGLFVLPLVLGLIGVAAFLADSKPFPQAPASKVWGFVHGVSLLLTTVAVFVGFAAGLMYLAQARRLKRKLPPRRGLRLPSLEWLQRVNSRALVVSLLMLGVGVLSGVLLDLVNHSGRLPFRDPVVLSSVFMFAWMAVSVGMGVVYRPAREGPKVAYLTTLSFAFLVIALAMALLVETQHGRPRAADSRAADSRFSAEGIMQPAPAVGGVVPELWRLAYRRLYGPSRTPSLEPEPAVANLLPRTRYGPSRPSTGGFA